MPGIGSLPTVDHQAEFAAVGASADAPILDGASAPALTLHWAATTAHIRVGRLDTGE